MRCHTWGWVLAGAQTPQAQPRHSRSLSVFGCWWRTRVPTGGGNPENPHHCRCSLGFQAPLPQARSPHLPTTPCPDLIVTAALPRPAAPSPQPRLVLAHGHEPRGVCTGPETPTAGPEGTRQPQGGGEGPRELSALQQSPLPCDPLQHPTAPRTATSHPGEEPRGADGCPGTTRLRHRRQRQPLLGEEDGGNPGKSRNALLISCETDRLWGMGSAFCISFLLLCKEIEIWGWI